MKMPDYIDCKITAANEKGIFAVLTLKYFPLGIFLNSFIRVIGFRIWLYPKMIKHILTNLAVELK